VSAVNLPAVGLVQLWPSTQIYTFKKRCIHGHIVKTAGYASEYLQYLLQLAAALLSSLLLLLCSTCFEPLLT